MTCFSVDEYPNSITRQPKTEQQTPVHARAGRSNYDPRTTCAALFSQKSRKYCKHSALSQFSILPVTISVQCTCIIFTSILVTVQNKRCSKTPAPTVALDSVLLVNLGPTRKLIKIIAVPNSASVPKSHTSDLSTVGFHLFYRRGTRDRLFNLTSIWSDQANATHYYRQWRIKPST